MWPACEWVHPMVLCMTEFILVENAIRSWLLHRDVNIVYVRRQQHCTRSTEAVRTNYYTNKSIHKKVYFFACWSDARVCARRETIKSDDKNEINFYSSEWNRFSSLCERYWYLQLSSTVPYMQMQIHVTVVLHTFKSNSCKKRKIQTEMEASAATAATITKFTPIK